MKKISYSKDVDALLIELSDEMIAYAEDEGQAILHYSKDAKLVLVEILDFRRLMSNETITALLAS
jgi:ubiquinone biosynthesis protein COQ9